MLVSDPSIFAPLVSIDVATYRESIASRLSMTASTTSVVWTVGKRSNKTLRNQQGSSARHVKRHDTARLGSRPSRDSRWLVIFRQSNCAAYCRNPSCGGTAATNPSKRTSAVIGCVPLGMSSFRGKSRLFLFSLFSMFYYRMGEPEPAGDGLSSALTLLIGG